LDSSRLQSGKVVLNSQILRIDALLNDVVAHARVHHSAVQITLDIRQELPSLMGDPRRLKQVFDNLIANSAKYAPGSGIHIRVYRETNGISLDFRDRGPGIPAKDLDKIFERFYRSDAHADLSHGSGLGLFISKKIIEAHQGEISATSMLGKGTTIHIFLPLEEVQ
jgi:signal transduction histidine kinase